MKFRTTSAIVLMSFFIALFPTSAEAAPTASELVSSMNAERTSRGLSALRVDSALTQAAQGRSQVLTGLGYLVHVSAPAGVAWKELEAVGYKYVYAGENLALGYDGARETMTGWMNSPTHRDNILGDNYGDIGVGISMGTYEGRQTPYVVVFFGQKRRETAVKAVSLLEPVAQAPVVTRALVAQASPVTSTLVPVTDTPRAAMPASVVTKSSIKQSVAKVPADAVPDVAVTTSTIESASAIDQVVVAEAKEESSIITELIAILRSIFGIRRGSAGR